MIARASALALLVALNAAGAQSTQEVRLDAGAAQVQQTGRTAHDAAGVFGGTWRGGSPLFGALLSAALTSAGDSTSAAQASLSGAWRPTTRSAWQSEGGMGAAAFGSSILARGGSFSGFFRERLAIESGGVWAGGAFGGTSRDNLGSHSTALELGGWYSAGPLEASASVARVRSGDHPLLEAAGIFLDDELAWYDLTDLTTDLRYERGPLVVDATGTFRNGARTTTADQSALYVTAVWAFSPRCSFVLGTGRQLADPVRGVPDMRITYAALRVTIVSIRTPAPAPLDRGVAFATLSRKSSGALLLVRVMADDSSHVEVAGTFSDWKPVPLTRSEGGWDAEIALPPGRHRVAVRVNGGPWMAPAGTVGIRDEFGGETGLVVVP